MSSSKLNVYVRFVQEKGRPRPGILWRFAVVSFGGATLTDRQVKDFTERLKALPSCENVVFGGKTADRKAIIDSVRHGDPAEENFFTEVEECLRKHYTVKRVTYPKNMKAKKK